MKTKSVMCVASVPLVGLVLVVFNCLVTANGAAPAAADQGLPGNLDRARAAYVSALEEITKSPETPSEVKQHALIELARVGDIKGYEGIAGVLNRDDPLSQLGWVSLISRVTVDSCSVDVLLDSKDEKLRGTGVLLVGEMAAIGIDEGRLNKLWASKADSDRCSAIVFCGMARRWDRIGEIAKMAGDEKESAAVRKSAMKALGEYVGQTQRLTPEEFKKYLEGIVRTLPVPGVSATEH